MSKTVSLGCRLSTMLLLTLAGASAQGQHNIMPEAVCAEYYTAPVTGAIGVVGSRGSSSDFGTTLGKGYIGHYAYMSTEAGTITLPKGILTSNFFAPAHSTYPNQPTVFIPGHSPTFRVPLPYAPISYYLAGNHVALTPIGLNDISGPIPPSPTCAPEFVPSTSINLGQPGTYQHQYLGQVDSGPADMGTSTFAVTALSGHPNIIISNATYLANDTANPANTLNPNSIYADITITAAISGPASVEFQLAVNGVAIVSGVVSVSH